jgi:hypothetical protein
MRSKIELGSDTMEMEQMMQKIREMMSVVEAVLNTNPKEASPLRKNGTIVDQAVG